MAAATTVVLRRAKISKRKRRDQQELYPSQLPDEKEWLASFDIEMLLLDG